MLDRIKEKAQQARSLLSPWLRKSDSQGETASGHLQITDRHRLAARKMRVLDDQKLGGAHPQTVLSLNAGLSERMQSIQNMLHFNANISRDTSIWPKVDQVFPSQAAEAPRQPEQPGVMKAGTVIQKFSMTPKPGQSIQSFKEQMSRQNQAPAPAPRPKAPVLPAKTRLFSRVQEITQREKSFENETGDHSADAEFPVTSPAPSLKAFDLPEPSQETEPEAVSKPLPEVLKPAQVEKEPVPTAQKDPVPVRQVEPVPPSDTPSKPEREDTLLPSKSEAASKMDMPVHLPPEAKSPQTAPSDLSETGDKEPGAVKQARPVSDQAKTVKPDIPLKAAARPSQPADKKPAPPASRPSQTVQRQLDNRTEKSTLEPAQQPVLRPPAASLPLAARRENDLPPLQTETAKPSIAKAVHSERETQPSTPMTDLPVLRQAVKPVVRAAPPASMPADILVQSSEPREQDITPPPVLPQPPASSLDAPTFGAASQTQSEDSILRSAPTAAPIPAGHDISSAQPSMPLHTRLLARKGAVQSIKPAVPEMLRAVQSKPLLQPRAGLVTERKYRFESHGSPSAPPTPMVHSASTPFTPSAPSVPSASSVVQRAMEPVQPTQQTEPSAVPLNLLLAAAHTPQAAPVQQARPVSVSQQAAPASQTAQPKVEKTAESNQSEAAAGSLSQQKPPKLQIGPLKTSKSGVVQRRWDEHSGPDAVTRSGSERQEETQQLPVDLDQVASDVLPLVKRLLDIELERLSGGFH
jgi:hypothetical protein